MKRHSDALLAAGWVILALSVAAAAQTPEPKTVKLKFRTGGGVGTIYTPAKLVGRGKEFRFHDVSGRIKLFGQSILVAGRYVLDGYLLGVDCNGDDKIAGSEWVRLSLLTYSAKFGLRLPDGEKKRDQAVRFTGVSIGVQANRVNNVSGRVMNDGCMAGKLSGHDVLLFDDNMDGEFTQDGKDAIAIGGSPGAMPLHKQHQVGKSHYVLDVAGDGTSITFQPIEEKEVGLVDVPVRASLLRCLVLVDETNSRAYDVRASGRAGIPAGTYKLAYAVLGAGRRIVVAGPSSKSLSYPITAKVLNVLRFGPPTRLTFEAYVHWRDQQVRVRTNVTPYGTGGEKYSLRFAGYHPLGENPHVMLTNGRTILTNGHMIYDGEDRLREFADWIPNGFNKATGQIVVSCDLPVLGKAVGKRPLSEIIEKKKATIPDPKTPAVATKKLHEGVAVAKHTEPKPKPKPPPPPPPPPRPRPKPRPTKPRAADPEYDAAVLLDVAKAFLKQGKRDMGVAKLKAIIGKYRGTTAAKEADDMLIDIEVEDEEKSK